MNSDTYNADKYQANEDVWAEIDREIEALEEEPLKELLNMLTPEQRREMDIYIKEHLLDTYGIDIAKERLEDDGVSD